jgi:GxxExxY protein
MIPYHPPPRLEGRVSDQLRHRHLTDQIIKAFYKVYNRLGYGFLEKVYENALALELQAEGLSVKQQPPVKVYYGQQAVGEYYADLVVEDRVILELKSAEALHQSHEAQLLNYLKATQIEIGLLLNFGPRPEFRRKLFTNDKQIAHG